MGLALSTTLHTTFADAVERTKAALAEQGFGVLTEINMTATLKAKLGADIEDYVILGACNPPLAHRAVEANRQIGLLLPCNVVVRRDITAPDNIVVDALDPAVMVEVTADRALGDVADEAASKLRAAIDSLRARDEITSFSGFGRYGCGMADLAESVARRYAVLRPHLTEFQRRLWLGAEAAELGSGGVAVVAEATGVPPDTVRRGRKEAEEGTVRRVSGRSRQPGGGRKRAEAHDAGLGRGVRVVDRSGDPGRSDVAAAVDVEVDPDVDRGVAGEWAPGQRFRGPPAAAELGYSLQANAKTTEGGQHADRDAQFGYLNDQAEAHLAAGDPVISVDTKKKELVGAYKNGGREWQPDGRAGAGQGPRLHRPRPGQGQPVRGLRRGRQHRLGLGGHRPRHRGVRRGHHPHLVAAASGQTAVPRRVPAADLRRRRRLQRLPHPAVEDRARRTGRPHRPDDHRVPPAARHHPSGTRSSTGCSPTSR